MTWPDGTQTHNIPVNAEGNWTVESPTSQNTGELSATFIDLAGNMSSPVITQYVDLTPPVKHTVFV